MKRNSILIDDIQKQFEISPADTLKKNLESKCNFIELQTNFKTNKVPTKAIISVGNSSTLLSRK